MKALFLLIALEVCLPAALALSAVASVQAEQGRWPRATPEAIRDGTAALSAPDPVARALAACRLGAMGERAEMAMPALMRLLADASPIVPVDCRSTNSSPGLEAARALASIGSAAAIDPLLDALRSPNPELRRNAARALGLIMRRFR